MTLLHEFRAVMFLLWTSAGLVAAPGFCAALEIEPGQWQSSETSAVDGKPGEPEVSIDCVSAEDARDPVKALSGMQSEASGKCRMFDVNQAGNVVSFAMTCGDAKEGEIQMRAKFVFENTKHYTGALTSVMSAMGLKTTSTMTVDAKWVGACKE
jgi:hypothetical protein